jgi:hypothetical protein
MYAAHSRLPANLRIAPHFQPDERIVTVLSGTVHFGYGERFDERVLEIDSPAVHPTVVVETLRAPRHSRGALRYLAAVGATGPR